MLLSTTELHSRLALVDTLSVSPGKQYRLLKIFGSARAVLTAGTNDLLSTGLLKPEQAQKLGLNFDEDYFAKKLKDITSRGIQVLCHDDPLYPSRLLHTANFPLILFCRGDAALLSSHHVVAFVGTRTMTDYGQRVVAKLVPQLTQAGVVIVSGMANGIDAAVHSMCVEAHGKTIAVQAQGVLQGHPTGNQLVFERILASGGCVVSEFPWVKDDKVGKYFFPRRNRLISGVSDAVVVVEADVKSGSLITARFALDQNRDVYAVPGGIDQPMSKGCLNIMRDGAHVIVDAESLLSDLGLKSKMLPQQELDLGRTSKLGLPADWDQVKPSFEAFASPLELKIIEACGTEARTMDEIIDFTGETSPSVSATITKLQIEGVLKDAGGRRFVVVE